MNPDSYDVVVIGGGAAGLSAALVLGRARRRVAVVDAGEPRNALPPTCKASGPATVWTRPSCWPWAGRSYGVDIEGPGAALAQEVEERFGVRLHRRTVERARS